MQYIHILCTSHVRSSLDSKALRWLLKFPTVCQPKTLNNSMLCRFSRILPLVRSRDLKNSAKNCPYQLCWQGLGGLGARRQHENPMQLSCHSEVGKCAQIFGVPTFALASCALGWKTLLKAQRSIAVVGAVLSRCNIISWIFMLNHVDDYLRATIRWHSAFFVVQKFSQILVNN